MDTTTPRARPRYGRWRAATLLTVYLLMGVHVAHWRLNGQTLAPLELNEVMHTLELGIVTAGFLFMALALVSVLIFGRFFCSWGCHLLALEDLCAWLLGKLGLRPRPVRSRVLMLVPPGAMLYMFVWPQLTRVAQGRPLPALAVLGDEQGWASFLTTDFARNLPGPGIALLTFAICGFLIVYVLGSRSFCRYACPYGVLFGLADRVAPGRIVSTGDCTGCARCTAACQSGVAVHRELAAFGTVVDPSCLKDLDCVAACPNSSIGHGFTRPPLLRPGLRKKRPRASFGFSWAEEILMGVVFLATLAVFRGLYGKVPFLLSLGIGVISAYLSVVGWRLMRRPAVRFSGLQIKLGGKFKTGGRAYAILLVAFVGLVAHSAFVRYHEFVGQRAFEQVAHPGRGDPLQIEAAIGHLEWTERWGLFPHSETPRHLGALYERLGRHYATSGDGVRAMAALETARRHRPEDAHILRSLGEMLADAGRFQQAAELFENAVEVDPADAPSRYNLAVVLTLLEREPEAVAQYREAARLAPHDPGIWNNLGSLLLRRQDLDGAEPCFRKAIELDGDFAHPHFNLGRLLALRGRLQEALSSMQRAAALDPVYAQLLESMNEAGGRRR